MDRCGRHDGGFCGALGAGRIMVGVTLKGAYAGLLGGFTTFIIIHTQVLEPAWFSGVGLEGAVTWLRGEGPNPYSCAVMGEIVSLLLTFVVSKRTAPLPEEHLNALFSDVPNETSV